MRLFIAGILAVALVGGGEAKADKGNETKSDNHSRASALDKQGTILARQKHYDAAISKYKESQRLHFSWRRLCNIGVTFQYMNRWPQAELFLRRCKVRANTFPAAMAPFVAATMRKLKSGQFAQVRLRIDPADASVTTAAFAVDDKLRSGELFWLPLGKHTITIKRAGMRPRLIHLDLTNTSPVKREVTLEKLPPVVAKTPANLTTTTTTPTTTPKSNPLQPTPRQPTDNEQPRSRVGTGTWLLLGGGVLSLGAGALFHTFALSTFDRAVTLPAVPAGQPHPEYEAELDTFNKQRLAAVGLYAAGAIATGVSVYLWLRARKRTDKPAATVGAVPLRGGAAMFARWSL